MSKLFLNVDSYGLRPEITYNISTPSLRNMNINSGVNKSTLITDRDKYLDHSFSK